MLPARPLGPDAPAAAVANAGVVGAAASAAAFVGCLGLSGSISIGITHCALAPVGWQLIRTHVLLMVHLGLRWIEMLHGMRIRIASAWWHARRHESGGGVDLRSWSRHTHMAHHVLLHSRRSAGLARIMGHARRHRVTGRGARMLLHPAGVWRKRRAHASHHLRGCRLSTAWISTWSPRRYRMRSSADVAGWIGATGGWQCRGRGERARVPKIGWQRSRHRGLLRRVCAEGQKANAIAASRPISPVGGSSSRDERRMEGR